MTLIWEPDATIRVTLENGALILSANEAGLVSLSRHLFSLAKETAGSHLHLDDSNALEDGSAELILEKTE